MVSIMKGLGYVSLCGKLGRKPIARPLSNGILYFFNKLSDIDLNLND